MQTIKILTIISLFLSAWPSLHAQEKAPKSIIFPELSYSQHPLVKFRTIRSRSLPLTKTLDQYAPFPVDVKEDQDRNAYLIAFYAKTIRKAFLDAQEDRAFINDTLAPKLLADFEMPAKGYRLFTSRNKRYDKIKRIRYAIKRGVPLLAGLRKKTPDDLGYGLSHWDGVGEEEGHTVLVTGYDSKTASFQLMETKGVGWGEKGFFWMTYQDFLKAAKEVVALRNPTLSQTLAEEKQAISLDLKVEALQLHTDNEKDFTAKKLAVAYQNQEKIYRFTDQKSVGANNRYQIQIEIPKGRCLYLFTAHADGSTTPAWMMEYNYQDTTVTLPPVSSYQLPEEGKEHFVLLYSHKPIPRWRRYLDRMEYMDASTPLRQKLYRAFERYLLPESQLEYVDDEMQVAVELEPSNKYVLPMIIEWEMAGRTN